MNWNCKKILAFFFVITALKHGAIFVLFLSIFLISLMLGNKTLNKSFKTRFRLFNFLFGDFWERYAAVCFKNELEIDTKTRNRVYQTSGCIF